MNDTESRLRDYLDAKAATVPNNEQGPGLLAETPHRRSPWPVLATAASVAAVLALTVTVLTHLGPDKADPAGRPAPLTNAAPKVPFSITGPDWKGKVYDGDWSTEIPKNVRPTIARVAGGLLADYFEQVTPKTEPHVGILKRDGSFRRLGPEVTDTPVKSPDGTQVALVTRSRAKGSTKGAKIAILDVKTGAVVASVPVPHLMAGPMGWNTTGIWIHNGDIAPRARLWLWKPGEAALRPVQTDPAFDLIETSPQTDTVVITLSSRPPAGSPPRVKDTASEHCFQAGVFRNGKLDLRPKYCEMSQLGTFPVLSTDGRRVMTSAGTVVELATGKTTKLRLDQQITGNPGSLFEDPTKVLVIARAKGDIRQQSLYRCEATTGECKLIRTEKPGNEITLGQP